MEMQIPTIIDILTIRFKAMYPNLKIELSMIGDVVNIRSINVGYHQEFTKMLTTLPDTIVISALITWGYEQTLFNFDYILGELEIDGQFIHLYLKRHMVNKFKDLKMSILDPSL